MDGFDGTTWLAQYTPALDKELADVMEARLAASKAADAATTARTPPVTDKGAPVGADNVDGKAGGPGVSGESVGGGDKGVTPTAPDAPDLGWCPEGVRSKIQGLDPETIAVLKSGFMAHSEATKRFTEAKALTRDADNYRALVSDPDLAALVTQAIMDKKAGKKIQPSPKAPEPEPDDIDWGDPKAVTAEMRRIAAAEAEAKAKAEAETLRKEIAGPSDLRNAVNTALNEYQSENAVPPKVMEEAVKAADAALLKRGQRWDPTQVATLMDGFVEAARVKYAAKPQPPVNGQVVPPNGHTGTDEVASPNGRAGSKVAQHVPFPSFFVNGQRPARPLTTDEYEELGLYATRKRLGPDVTLEDYRGAGRTR